MRSLFRHLFAFVLTPLEAGNQVYAYKRSHRVALLIVGVLFAALASAIVFIAEDRSPGYLFPALVFGVVGVLALIVGALGNDRAVAKIWGQTAS